MNFDLNKTNFTFMTPHELEYVFHHYNRDVPAVTLINNNTDYLYPNIRDQITLSCDKYPDYMGIHSIPIYLYHLPDYNLFYLLTMFLKTTDFVNYGKNSYYQYYNMSYMLDVVNLYQYCEQFNQIIINKTPYLGKCLVDHDYVNQNLIFSKKGAGGYKSITYKQMIGIQQKYYASYSEKQLNFFIIEKETIIDENWPVYRLYSNGVFFVTLSNFIYHISHSMRKNK